MNQTIGDVTSFIVARLHAVFNRIRHCSGPPKNPRFQANKLEPSFVHCSTLRRTSLFSQRSGCGSQTTGIIYSLFVWVKQQRAHDSWAFLVPRGSNEKKILRTCLFQPINMYESMNILKYNTWNKLNCLSYFHRCICCSSHHTNVNYLFRARHLFHWTLFWLLTANQQSWRLFYSSFRWSLVQVTPSGGLYIGNPQTPNHIPSTSEKSIEWNTRFNVVLEKWGLFKVLITRVQSELACMHVKPKCLLGAYAGFIRTYT